MNSRITHKRWSNIECNELSVDAKRELLKKSLYFPSSYAERLCFVDRYIEEEDLEMMLNNNSNGVMRVEYQPSGEVKYIPSQFIILPTRNDQRIKKENVANESRGSVESLLLSYISLMFDLADRLGVEKPTPPPIKPKVHYTLSEDILRVLTTDDVELIDSLS